MKRYTKMEINAAVAGLVFIIFGVVMIVRPTEFAMTPDSTGAKIRAPSLGSDKLVNVSKTGSEVYGVLSVVMGAGICWLALYRKRE